jgi:hypothetical protein
MSLSQTLSSSPAVVRHSAPQAGVATIALGATTAVVANTAITANSVVLCQPMLNDATAVRVAPVLAAGVGFTITAPVATTAALPVSYFIARY